MQISRSSSFMQSCMPSEQSFILILLSFGSNSALSLLDVSPVPVHPTHCLATQEASCRILHNLLAVHTFLLIEFCLEILEVWRNFTEIKFEIRGHKDLVYGHIDCDRVRSRGWDANDIVEKRVLDVLWWWKLANQNSYLIEILSKAIIKRRSLLRSLQ